MRIKVGNRYIEKSAFLFLIAIYTLLKVYRNSINYADTTQGGIWNVILVLLVLYGFISFFSCFINNNVIRASIFYAIVIWLNGLLTLNINGLNGLYYYIVAPCFAPIMVFLYKATLLEGYDESKLWDVSWIIIFALLLYTYIRFFGRYQYYESSGKIALNNSYYAACAIPFFLRKRNKYGLAMVILAVVIVFISNKRAGLIGIAVSLAYYYLINAKKSGSFMKALKRLTIGVVVFAFIFLLFNYIDSRYSLNVFSRLLKLFDDGGSGRMTIYSYVWNEIIHSNLFEFFFGHGVSSVNHMGMQLSSAHSDFLNVFYEYGFFAFLALCFFYISLFRCHRSMIMTGYINSDVFAYSIILSLFFSLFSANLDNQSFSLILASYWGIEIGCWKKQLSN